MSVIDSKNITKRMTLQLDQDVDVNKNKSWSIRIIDEATGLCIMVGDPYYWTKKKAEDAFESTGSLLVAMTKDS